MIAMGAGMLYMYRSTMAIYKLHFFYDRVAIPDTTPYANGYSYIYRPTSYIAS